MKKNFNVNIAGVIFHMDEDAYEKLEAYLGNLRRHFSAAEGKEEILADIESRIAEVLQTKLNETKEVIVLEDIELVIATLGQPSDWGDETEKAAAGKRARPKRLYRDPDNKVIGGVCSGLGAYFNVDPLWIRLGFVVITLAGFGAGIVAYILLWALAPEARTTAEKLEMRGEKVTVSNIEKSIKEEFDGIKGKVTDLTTEARDAFERNKARGATFFEKIFAIFLQVISVIFKIIVVFFGLLFVSLGLFLLIGFLISFIDTGHEIYISSFGISAFSLPAILRLFLDSKEQTLAILGLVLVIGIPLILLIYIGARLLFRFKSRSRFIGIPAFSLILAGLVMCTIVGVHVFKSFSQKAVTQTSHVLKQPAGNTLVIDAQLPPGMPNLPAIDNDFMIGNWNLYNTGDTTLFFGIPSLEVVKSENDSFSLNIYYIAKGENHEQARERAKNIHYDFAQTDSSLLLNTYYYIPMGDKIRGQEVKLIMRVPSGKNIKFKPGTEVFYEHNNNYQSQDLSGRRWIMSDQGLKEVKPVQPPDSVRVSQ